MSRPQLLRRFGGPWRLVLGCAWACCAAHAQVATSAADFGPADPVVISGTWTLQPSGPGAFDFGPRNVVFASGAVVTTNGARIVGLSEVRVDAGATLLGAVTLAPSGSSGQVVVAGTIDGSSNAPFGNGGDITLTAATWVRLKSSGLLRSRPGPGGGAGGDIALSAMGAIIVEAGAAPIDVSGYQPDHAPGSVHFSSAGEIEIARSVATSAGLGGGSIGVFAGSYVTIVGDWNASSTNVCGGFAAGGAVTIHAGFDVAIQGSITTSGSPLCPWDNAGDIDVFSPHDLTVLGVLRANSSAGSNDVVLTAVGDLFHQGAIDVRGNSADGFAGRGGSVSIVAGGSVHAPPIDARGGLDYLDIYDLGGSVTIVAGEDLAVEGVDTYGVLGGSVSVSAPNGDVATGAIRTAANETPTFGNAGAATILAGRDALIGAIDAFGAGYPGVVTITAGRHASLAGVAAGSNVAPPSGTFVSAQVGGTLEIDGPIDYPAAGAGPPVVDLAACRFRINGAIAPHGGVNPGAAVRFVAGDVLTVRAPVSAAPSGQILMTTRLATPYSPEFEAAGAATPPATVVHDPTLPPCLALGAASLAATPHAAAFAPFVVAAAGPPLRPLLVVVGFASPPWPLGGALGYAQVSPVAAAVLADPGVLGPPAPGSALDAAGTWSFSALLPPGLAGQVLTTAAFVFDGEAANGLFHQPPAAFTHCE